MVKSYSLCGVTPTYLTLQSVDAVKQALDPRVIDNADICQLHYKIVWVHHERPNFYKCGSRHARSTMNFYAALLFCGQ